MYPRIGSKFMMRDMILPLIPSHSIYIEPFAGSAAIAFTKKPAALTILNDLDKYTCHALLNLQDAPEDVKSYPSIDSIDEAKDFFCRRPTTPQEWITWHIIRSSCGYNGNPVKEPKNIYHKICVSSKVMFIPALKEQLKNAVILCADYAAVIQEYDSRGSFIFLDPPYENTAKNFGYAEDRGFDFERLNSVLLRIKGNFLMTINDSPRIRAIFSAFYITPYIALSRNHSKRPELFISNYDLPILV